MLWKWLGRWWKLKQFFFFLLCTRNYNWTYMYINACMSVHTMKAKSLQPPSNWLFLQQTFHSYQQKQTVEEYWCGVHSRKEQPTAVKVLLCGKQSENIQNTRYKNMKVQQLYLQKIIYRIFPIKSVLIVNYSEWSVNPCLSIL